MDALKVTNGVMLLIRC